MSRRAKALQLRLQGFTYQAIGSHLGVSRQRIQQLLSPPKPIRDLVIRRAKEKCERCGVRCRGYGNVHHKNVEQELEEQFNDLDNLQWLCLPCHKFVHAHSTVPSTKDEDRTKSSVC